MRNIKEEKEQVTNIRLNKDDCIHNVNSNKGGSCCG